MSDGMPPTRMGNAGRPRRAVPWLVIVSLCAPVPRIAVGGQRETPAAIELSGPQQMTVVEGLPITIPLTFRNRSQTPQTIDIRYKLITVVLDELAADGSPRRQVARGGRCLRPDVVLPYTLGKTAIRAGDAAYEYISLRRWVPSVPAGLYKATVTVPMAGGAVAHSVMLKIMRNEKELRQKLSALEAEMIEADLELPGLLAEAREYDPRYTVDLYLRLLEARYTRCLRAWMDDVLGAIDEALAHGCVEQPDRVLKRLKAIGSRPGTTPALEQWIADHMSGLVPVRPAPELAAALRQHFGVVPPQPLTSTGGQVDPQHDAGRRLAWWVILLLPASLICGLALGVLVTRCRGRWTGRGFASR